MYGVGCIVANTLGSPRRRSGRERPSEAPCPRCGSYCATLVRAEGANDDVSVFRCDDCAIEWGEVVSSSGSETDDQEPM